MYTVMKLQATYFTECFITHITSIWMITSMYTVMYLQVTFVTECFITQLTAIWTLPSMYMLMYILVSALMFVMCVIRHSVTRVV